MKSLLNIKLLVAILVFINCIFFSHYMFSQKTTCFDLHKKNFWYKDKRTGDMVIIVRNDTMQHEENIISHEYFDSKIEWISECKYILTDYKNTDTIKCDIIEIDSAGYLCKVEYKKNEFSIYYNFIKSTPSDSTPKIVATRKLHYDCYNEFGKPNFETAYYTFKDFYTSTLIEIKINSIKLDSQIIKTNIFFTDTIESETKIIDINESFGLKLVIGKIIENDIKKYIFKIIIYKKEENIVNCWKFYGDFSYIEVRNQLVDISRFSIGEKNKNGYLEILEGSIKFN